MKITDLNNDILDIIYSYLKDSDSINLSLTCKTLNFFFQNYGALKTIRISNYDNYPLTIEKISNHKRTIKEMYLEDLEDPHLWIPYYPKILYIERCRYSYFDPVFKSNTEIIYCDDRRINKKKFKRAKILGL